MKVFPVYALHLRLPGPSVHSYVPPPPPVPPAVFPFPGPSCAHIELPHLVKWLTAGKMTTTVRFDGSVIAKDGHDSGALVPHAALPANAGILITLLFTKYKVLFGASAVKANGDAVGTYFPVLAPPLYCTNPCAMPAAVPGPHNILPFPATVRVGMTFADFFMGWAVIAFEVVTDLIATAIFNRNDVKELFRKPFQEIMEGYVTKQMTPLLRKLKEKLIQDFQKKVVGGIVKILVGLLFQGKGGRIDLPVLGVGVAWDPKTGKVTVGTPTNPSSLGTFDYDGPGPAGSPGPAGHDALDMALVDGAPHAA